MMKKAGSKHTVYVNIERTQFLVCTYELLDSWNFIYLLVDEVTSLSTYYYSSPSIIRQIRLPAKMSNLRGGWGWGMEEEEEEEEEEKEKEK